jgi:hypothetical protein
LLAAAPPSGYVKMDRVAKTHVEDTAFGYTPGWVQGYGECVGSSRFFSFLCS